MKIAHAKFALVLRMGDCSYHSLVRQSISSAAHWSYDLLVLRPIGPTYSLEVFCPTSDWSNDPSLVPHLIGPPSHWFPISLVPHLIGPPM